MDPTTELTTEPSTRSVALGPVGAAERFQTIDLLRGFALLGILVMNISHFALSDAAYFNPRLGGDFTGVNFAVWVGSHVLFDMKMMSIFSMLFGAGLVVMTERAAQRGRPLTGVHYRRMLWLLLFGLIHAYLIWFGDILYGYALCGLLLYAMRRLRPRTLMALSAVFLSIGMLSSTGQGIGLGYMRDAAERAERMVAQGETPPPEIAWAPEAWAGTKKGFEPSAKDLETERKEYQGSYLDLLPRRAGSAIFMETFLFVFFIVWRALGMMTLGMALMKLGVFTGERPKAFYLKLAVIGYGVGIPTIAAGVYDSIKNDFDFVHFFHHGGHFNYFGSIGVALGHVGLIVLWFKSGMPRRLVSSLSAVGRMALSNYLMQSLICTTAFYGQGFGMWGSLSRVELLGFVLAVWAFQLVVSPLWLSAFRFGPMEWLWRTLTYWRMQPMRNDGAPRASTGVAGVSQ